MRKIVPLLLVFMTTGCASGKWVWEMTEAELELDRIATRQQGTESELYPLLQWIEAVVRALTEWS